MNWELLKTGPYIPIAIFLVVDLICHLMWEDYAFGIFEDRRKKRQDIILWFGGLSLALDYVGVCTGFTCLRAPATIFMQIIGAILVLRVVGVHWIYENRRDIYDVNQRVRETSEHCEAMTKVYSSVGEEIDRKVQQGRELLKRMEDAKPAKAEEIKTEAIPDTGFQMTVNGKTLTFPEPFPIQHPERIFLVPNGVWENVKEHFHRQTLNLENQEALGGITVIPIYSMDILANDMYHNISCVGNPPKYRLAVTCYSWNPTLTMWDTRCFYIMTNTPDATKADVTKCLTLWLVEHGARNGFHSFIQVYDQYVQMVKYAAAEKGNCPGYNDTQTASPSEVSHEVPGEVMGNSLASTQGDKPTIKLNQSETKPWLIRDDMFTINFGIDNATIMHVNQMDRIVLPSAAYMMLTTPIAAEAIHRILTGYTYVEVDETNKPKFNITNAHVTFPDGLPGIPTDDDMYFAEDTDVDIGTFNIFRFYHNDSAVWYDIVPHPIHLTCHAAVSLATVKETVAWQLYDLCEPHKIAALMDKFIEYIPHLELDTVPKSKVWTFQCITQSAFDIIKSNTQMKTLYTDNFITEDGSVVPFNNRDGWQPIFDFLRTRAWVVVPNDAKAVQFELSESTLRYERQPAGRDTRVGAFCTMEMDRNGHWSERWLPFYYDVGKMDGEAIQSIITQYSNIYRSDVPSIIRTSRDLINAIQDKKFY